MDIDYEDIYRRAKAISDKTPEHIRARVAYQEWHALQEWRLNSPLESNEPIDFDNSHEKD